MEILYFMNGRVLYVVARLFWSCCSFIYLIYNIYELFALVIETAKQAGKWEGGMTKAGLKPASLRAEQLLWILSMCTSHFATLQTRLVVGHLMFRVGVTQLVNVCRLSEL